ncbi:MAG TPA: hypothetical protein VK716_01070 [Terracidiphilus sp.]|nr:hypothetical protein [Terracidiphilus sp.]
MSAGFKRKTHWEKFWGYYVLAAAVLLFVLYVYPSNEKDVGWPLVAEAHPAPGASVVATLKNNQLHGVDEAVVTVQASSNPDTQIENMKVCADAPEFRVDPEDGARHRCVPVIVFDKGDVAEKPVPAELDLIPRATWGNTKILLTVSWVRWVEKPGPPVSGKNKAPEPTNCVKTPGQCQPLEESGALTLGPVNLGVNRMTRFASRLSSFLKDLTLPIILIFLANWLTGKASVHEEERQIAHILLPKVMRLAGRFYLPMAHSAGAFIKKSTDRKKNAQELIFYLLSFFQVARALKEKEGGVFFVDMAAEQIFMIANNLIRAQLVTALNGEKEFMKCLDQLDAWPGANVKRWARFSDWPATPDQTVTDAEKWMTDLTEPKFKAVRYLMGNVAATLRYESNAPFASWYSNSRGENLFVIAQGLERPEAKVFGDESTAGLLRDFEKQLALYTPGKTGS